MSHFSLSPRRLLLAAGLALTSLCAAPVAAHAQGWAPGPTFGEMTISDAEMSGGLGGYPSVGADAAGTLHVGWIEPFVYGLGATAVTARIAPDGSLGATRALGPAASNGSIAVATAQSGATAAAWVAPGDGGGVTEVRFVTVAADGTPGAERVLFSGVGVGAATLRVAVSDDGAATVAWTAVDDDSSANALHVRRVAPDGSVSTPVVIPGPNESESVALAAASAGAVWVAWSAADLVHAARLTPAGALDGAPVQLNTPGTTAGEAIVAASADAAVAVWTEQADEDAEREYRLSRLGSAGAVAGAALDVTEAGAYAEPSVALAPDGTVSFAHTGIRITAGGVRTSAELIRVTAAGAVAPAIALSGSGSPWSLFPMVDAAADGTVTAAWYEVGRHGEMTLHGRQISAAGAPAPSHEISGGIAALQAPPVFVESFGPGAASVGWLVPRFPLGAIATARMDLAPPTVSASATASVELGAEAAFEAVASDDSGIASTWWELGDGSGSRSTSVRHRYGAPGDYTATFTAVDRAGNETVVTRAVTVVAPAPAPPTTPPTTARVPAGLKLGRVARRGAQVTIAGTLDRRAGGTVTIVYAQKVGRRSLSQRVTARISNGRFAASLRLTGALATVRGGRAAITVSYRGDEDTRAASARGALANPKPARRAARRR